MSIESVDTRALKTRLKELVHKVTELRGLL